MSLSEDEQRILRQIEAQFQAEDPKLARSVARTSVYTHSGRRLKLAIAGIVVGLALMVVFVSMQLIVGAMAGFLVAFASAVAAWYAFRRMTQAGIDDLKRRSRAVMNGRVMGNHVDDQDA
jgi:predicted histidine transporter YuiF (NhaC family)